MTAKTATARLRDPGTMFTDPDSDFSLSGNEERPLPKRQGQTLTARIRTGAIIVVDEPPTEPKPKTPSQMNKSELLVEIAKRPGLRDKLEALAREQSKKQPVDVANKHMAALITDFDSAQQQSNQRTGDPTGWSFEELLAEIEEQDGGKEKLEVLIQEKGVNSAEEIAFDDLLPLVQELMGIESGDGE